MKGYILALCMTASLFAGAQNVGVGTATPDNSAMLDVNSSSKGMLLPRMTSLQRKAISNPATGLLVFDTDKGSLMFFDGASWRAMAFTDENKSEPLARTPLQPIAGSGFGNSVAISGDYAIIGASKYGVGNIYQGTAYIFNRSANGWKEMARLSAWDSAVSDYFGGSVAISGDYAVVGAANKKIGANSGQGKVYVYHRTGTSWLLDTAFTKPAGVAYDNFGYAVGVCAYNSGGIGITVGIPYSDVGGTNRGELYCYRKTGSSWAFIQSLIPADLAVSDSYGTTISMDTDYVAVAAPNQANATYSVTNSGAVYIYAFGGGVWNFQQKIQGTTGQAKFGTALSLNSSTIAIGAPWGLVFTNTSPVVYIYKRTGATWANTTSIYIYNTEIIPAANQLTANGGGGLSIINTTFGLSLALSGNILIIGASGGLDFPNGGSSYYTDRNGTAYVFKATASGYFVKTNLIQSEYPFQGDGFGQSIGISGNQYIIGNPHVTVNGQSNTGNVYFGIESP